RSRPSWPSRSKRTTMEYLPLFSWKGRSYGSKIVIRAFFTAFSTPDHFALLAAATLLAAGAMLGFSTVRGGALRASVGSTEAGWHQSTLVSSDRRAQDTLGTAGVRVTENRSGTSGSLTPAVPDTSGSDPRTSLAQLKEHRCRRTDARTAHVARARLPPRRSVAHVR